MSTEQQDRTERQRSILKWLRTVAPSLAELYQGAVQMLVKREPAGYTRFIAHAVREIRNRLPDEVGPSAARPRVDYATRLDQITSSWDRPGGAEQISGEANTLEMIGSLIEDHKAGRNRPKEAAARLFSSVAPGNESAGTLLVSNISDWLEVTEWFLQRAHDRGVVDAELSVTELENYFERFELILVSLAKPFFETVKDLDEILRKANN